MKVQSPIHWFLLVSLVVVQFSCAKEELTPPTAWI
jgi:hypothetical protein